MFSAQISSPKINIKSKVIKNPANPKVITRQGNPAKNNSIAPETKSKIDVPRSGCLRTKNKGKRNKVRTNNQSLLEFKPSVL